MLAEQRKEELLQGLRNTGEEVVYVAINHVAEILGIEMAEKLHTPGTLAETQEAMRVQRVAGARQVTRQLRSGNAEFQRLPLIKALEAHKFTEEGESNVESVQTELDPKLLPQDDDLEDTEPSIL